MESSFYISTLDYCTTALYHLPPYSVIRDNRHTDTGILSFGTRHSTGLHCWSFDASGVCSCALSLVFSLLVPHSTPLKTASKLVLFLLTCESIRDPVRPSSSLVITQLAFAMVPTGYLLGCCRGSCCNRAFVRQPAEKRQATSDRRQSTILWVSTGWGAGIG